MLYCIIFYNAELKFSLPLLNLNILYFDLTSDVLILVYLMRACTHLQSTLPSLSAHLLIAFPLAFQITFCFSYFTLFFTLNYLQTELSVPSAMCSQIK